MSTALRMPRDDEVGLLSNYDHDSDDESPRGLHQQREYPGTRNHIEAGVTNLWPKDMVGRNLEAKMGTVAAEKVSIRLAFLRKVFGILSFQIILTTAICAALYCTPGLQGFIKEQSWVLLLSLVGSLGLIVALHIHARTVPLNYVLLASFTVVQALTLGVVVSMYDLAVVLEAVVLTASIVIGLFVYTLQSKRDFVQHYALTFSLAGVLMMAMMFQIVLQSPAFNFFVNVAGAAVFCFFLIIDIDLIMNHLSPEDYILACVTLYMDIINLFIRILEIINSSQR